MPAWVNAGFTEYSKRLPPWIKLDIIEIPLSKRTKHSDIQRMIQHEGELMTAEISSQDHVIALDVQGKQWRTEFFASKLQEWKDASQDVCFLIGGPEGLSAACLQRANYKLSLSELTFPHPIVRVIFAEQLYRAYTIVVGHPYHRE